ncbi:MAG: hypothetical protein MSA57_06490 [Ruminococcus sp.]|nr:hypothetical protein [Ruminococcus sp.]
MACYDSKNPNCGCCPPPPPMPTCCFQGPPGVTGAVGATGATGADGTAATVQVGTTTTGAPGTNASVTNTGTESNAVLNFVIPAGATGANGATGADGTAATIQVGSTTTGAPGTDASVTNTGTESNAVLNFVIPAGATGANGADGANGTAATVQVGTTTTGAPGTNASVTNTGTESNAVLNFVIPAGATGANGADGADGTAATVQVGTTTTGAPGTNASVTNTGTESNAVLNFVIPAGTTGANGADGATGADGTAATVQVGSTTTGAPGTNASVTNTGTESNAVLNFVIPAGATGANGADGADGTAATVQVGTTTTGAPGTEASVTNTGTDSNAVLNFVIPAGATGASAAESRPSVLAVQDTTEQALTENTPVSFAVNLLQSGTDLTHAAGSNQITVETPGIYQAAFTAEVSPTGTATLPLTISLSLEQGTTILETSSTTMTTAEQSNTLAWNIPFSVTTAPEVLRILSDRTDVILNRATLTINKIGMV